MRNIEAAHSTPGGARVAVCQLAGSRWSTIEGVAQVVTDADSVARAVGLYAAR
ncbi:hypothetical protein IEQ44_08365 [Nocardioides sp. Y6]|uniref:Uncharacterized protein n=1 Tax=Nocardioides malaquae TaxID=2773426 RepID=A0ABR9RTG0_9ACTN|nr:hypothetical protein [Nocardioides malaquae]MBE7324665.1 hypothetical protein [Nocardioides malaquae]